LGTLDSALDVTAVDPLDAAIDGLTQTRVRANVMGATQQNPDEFARATQLSRATGIPTPVVVRNLPQVQHRADMDALDTVLAQSPAVRKAMADPNFAILARDDVETLAAVERTLNRRSGGVIGGPAFVRNTDRLAPSAGPEPSFSSIAYGLFNSFAQGSARTREGIRLQFADAIGADAMGADALRRYEQAQSRQGLTTPAFESSTAKGLYGGGASTLQNLPGLVASIFTRSMVPSLAAAGVQTEMDAYGKYRARGAGGGRALLAATGEGAVEVATELIPLRTMLGAFGQPGKTFAREFAKSQVQEQFGEQVATILQDAIDTAVANPDKTWGQYLAERPDAAYQTALATLVQSGVMTAGHVVMSRMAGDEAKAAGAVRDAETLAQLAQLAAGASKLRPRDPQSFQDFVASTAEDGPLKEVYIDARTLQQAGVDTAALAQASPSSAAQIEEALATGGDLVIPVGEYAARIAGTDLDAALTPHLRTAEDALSIDEAQRFYQGQAEQFQQIAAQAMQEKASDDAWQQSAKAVEARLFDQLKSANRFTDDVNTAYATLMRDFYVATAARLGITPEEMFARYPIQVAAERVAGDRWMDQSPIRQVMRTVTDALGITQSRAPATPGAALEMGQFFQDTGRGAVERFDAQGEVTSYAERGRGSEFKSSTFYQGAGNRGEIAFGKDITQQPSVITLFKNADLSTFLHESGHFFLEVQTDIAAKLQQEAEIFGMDTLKPGERQILADNDALLRWFGIESLAEWYNLDFEQKRSYHEQFARGFEAYLFEGKAPSQELTGIFSRFRAWLVSVYKSIKALNVEINDEIRGVFDRLVATEDAIAQAEALRGMTPVIPGTEELSAKATQEALAQLQKRSLRDMRWLDRARGRILKQMQAEVKAKRAEAQMDARRDVMAEPVYRAWRFLTAKMTEDDTPVPVKKQKNGDHVDESKDSLFAAIAKLGGIDKGQIVSEWGLDPKERAASGVFGKHVIRSEGKGLKLDSMAEALAQYGYLTLDEHDKWDMREFEEKFFEELRGNPQYSLAFDYAAAQPRQAGDQIPNPEALLAGRLDLGELRGMHYTTAEIARLKANRMTAANGLHPDLVARLFDFTSGDHLVRELLAADRPAVAIEARTDQLMLERHGDLTDPDTLARAVDEAIHNEARARFVAAELQALADGTDIRQDTGRTTTQTRTNTDGTTSTVTRRVTVNVLAKAAKDFAATMIARKQIKAIKPAQHATAEARAAKAATAALKAGDTTLAINEKRNQLVQNFATRVAYDAISEIEKAVRYLRQFDGDIKTIDPEYVDQIHALLERFDLRASVSNKDAAKRASLLSWVEAMREAGFEPDIPPELITEASRKPFKEMTLEEMRVLVDTVKQIEHLGRLKHKLLTTRDQREFEAVRDDIVRSIQDNAKKSLPEERSSDRGFLVSMGRLFRYAAAIHRKFSSLARGFDGYKDGGPAWKYLVRNMNERGDFEAVEIEKATIALTRMLMPVTDKANGKLTAKQYLPSIGKSFSREERISMLLNMGNETNLERLMTGERLAPAQLQEVVGTLTKADAEFVNAVHAFIDSYWPQIAEKERRVTGRAPEKVEARPFTLTLASGDTIAMRGGYYPIAYDPIRSERSSADLNAEVARQVQQGLYSRAQTRRGHTKARSESTGRALRYDFGEVIANHVTQVIHDLAWHEYLIDANRLLRSGAIENAVREHYGVEVLKEMKDTLRDIAIGSMGAEKGATFWNHLRYGATIAGLGWNVFNTLQNLTGITQSMSRLGVKWVAKGAAHWAGDAVRMEGSIAQIHEKSDFMRLRAKTMNREINDIRNKVSGTDSKLVASYFYLQSKTQLMVDVPTWWGAYEKAMAQDEMTEDKAIALADQAVIDAQGSGQTKDLAGIQRGGAGMKLFTTFYLFFNTTFNLTAEAYGRTDFKKPGEVALFAADMALLYTIPALLATLIKAALMGDWDDEEKLAKKIVGDQLAFALGTVVGLRETAAGVQAALGVGEGFGYTGPASVRFFADLYNLGKQAHQGEADEAFWKALNNTAGVLFHYPATQINRTATGIAALADGRTDNPLALVMGAPPKR